MYSGLKRSVAIDVINSIDDFANSVFSLKTTASTRLKAELFETLVLPT